MLINIFLIWYERTATYIYVLTLTAVRRPFVSEYFADAGTKEAFNFKYTVNLDTQRIYFFANGEQVLPEYKLYMKEDAQVNLARPADFDLRTMGNKENKNTFTVDNYKFYRDELGALFRIRRNTQCRYSTSFNR